MNDPVNWIFFVVCLAFLAGSMVITRNASKHFIRISQAFLNAIPEIIRTLEDQKRITPEHEESIEMGITQIQDFQKDLQKLQSMGKYSLVFIRKEKR
jgi:hypothetical protein